MVHMQFWQKANNNSICWSLIIRPLLEEPIEVDIAETEATDSGDVEELMADPDMEDADESDVILEETEVDAGGDEDEVCLSDYILLRLQWHPRGLANVLLYHYHFN